ncbi:MAG: class I SAM-dependent methyltransferase [Rhodobacteraceae bacterium]|nr:class I SAM-dependent methyltransferase [Paracoccaceae bacterium]
MRTNTWFWDWIANRYAKMPVEDQDAYQKKLTITREYLTPDSEVLEFGCGTGSTALAHAPLVRHIRATDVSRKMIAIARSKADDLGIGNADFEQVDIESLTAPNGSYDLVMGHSILHLLDNKESAIARVFDLLKPGGVFVSSTVCIGNSYKYIKPFLIVGRILGIMPLIRFLSHDELEMSVKDAGFEIEQSQLMSKDQVMFIVARKST